MPYAPRRTARMTSGRSGTLCLRGPAAPPLLSGSRAAGEPRTIPTEEQEMVEAVMPIDTGGPAHRITDAMTDWMRANATCVVEVVVRPDEVISVEEMVEIQEEIGRPVDSWLAVPYLGAPTGRTINKAARTGTGRSLPRLTRSTRTARATTARRGAAHKSARRSGSTSRDDGGGSEPGPSGSAQPRGLSQPGRRANSLRVEVAR